MNCFSVSEGHAHRRRIACGYHVLICIIFLVIQTNSEKLHSRNTRADSRKILKSRDIILRAGYFSVGPETFKGFIQGCNYRFLMKTGVKPFFVKEKTAVTDYIYIYIIYKDI